MRDRYKQALWAEMVDRLGEDSNTDAEWAELHWQFLRSWEEGYGVIMLKEEDLYGAIWKREPAAVKLQGNRQKRLHSGNTDRSPKRKHNRLQELVPKSKGTLETFLLKRQQQETSDAFEESLPLAIWQKPEIVSRRMTAEAYLRTHSYVLHHASVPTCKQGRSLPCSKLQLQNDQDLISKRKPQKNLTEKHLYEKQKQKDTEILAKKKKKVEEKTALTSASTSRNSAVKVVNSILEYLPPNEFRLLPQISEAKTAHMHATGINLTPTKAQIKEPLRIPGFKNSTIAEKSGENVSLNYTVKRPNLGIQSMCNSISFDHNYSARNYNGFMSNDVQVEEQLVDDALEITSSVTNICEILAGEIDILNFSEGADDQLDMQVGQAENEIERSIRDFDNDLSAIINHHLECFDQMDMSPLQLDKEASDKNSNTKNAVHQLPADKTPLELEVAENNDLDYDYDDDDEDVLSVAASCCDFEEDMDEVGQEMGQQDKMKKLQSQPVDVSFHELKQQPEIMQSLYKATEPKPRTRATRFSAMPAHAASFITSSQESPAVAASTTPADVSQQRSQTFAARRPSLDMALFAPPYRLPYENTNVATMCTAIFNGSKYELFGIKCWNNLDNSCSKFNCNHQFHRVGEVVSRLMRLEKSQLISSYFDVIDSSKLFLQYFSCYADVFANRRLFSCLTQMITDCRLYRQLAAPFLSYIYTVLQQCGEERNGVLFMMRDLWLPSKANQFRELTGTMLKILASANWSDYMAELIDLFKNYRFPMPNEFMTDIVHAAIKKKELLQSALQLVMLRRIDGVHDEALIRVLHMIAHSGNSPPLGHNSNHSTPTLQHHHPYRHPPPNCFTQIQFTDQSNPRISAFGYSLSTQNGTSPSYTSVNSNNNDMIKKF